LLIGRLPPTEGAKDEAVPHEPVEEADLGGQDGPAGKGELVVEGT